MGRVSQAGEFSSVIAVLDDDIRYIRMVERVLSDEGIGVTPITTLDHDEAVRVLAAAGCQAALVDIMMYGQAAGFDLVRQIRETPATAALRLIVASGADREIGRHADFLRDHDCSVLRKPFEPDELIARVRPAPATGGVAPPALPAIANAFTTVTPAHASLPS